MTSYEKYCSKVKASPDDFSLWTSFIDAADKTQDIEKSRTAYNAFFEKFPFCYGYWKKFAELERHKTDKEKALEVYERGVKAIPLSVDLWIAYADTAVDVYHNLEGYAGKMRNLYENALNNVGLEFRSDPLWENYISWETGYGNIRAARLLYERLLATPTQMYFQNWDSFKRLIEDNSVLEYLTTEELGVLHAQVNPEVAAVVANGKYGGVTRERKNEDGEEITEESADTDENLEKFPLPLNEEEAIKQLLILSREKIYQTTYQEIMKRWYFEEKIRRPYFHVKPLEDAQVVNWSEYISFEEHEALKMADKPEQSSSIYSSHAGPKRVRVLYERCLVACALYEHVWIRYAKYLEQVEGDLEAALDVWNRACLIHLKAKPTVHLHYALFLDKYPHLGLKNASNGHPRNGYEVMTELEKVLPDSALVCSRKVDFMRRNGAQFVDIMMCLRSGINRLRYAAADQYKKAYEVEGDSASMSASRALLLSNQARAGSGFLSVKIARLLYKLLPEGKTMPRWKLMLDSSYYPHRKRPRMEVEEPERKIEDEKADSGSPDTKRACLSKEESSKPDEETNGETMPINEEEFGSPPACGSDVSPMHGTDAEEKEESKAVESMQIKIENLIDDYKISTAETNGQNDDVKDPKDDDRVEDSKKDGGKDSEKQEDDEGEFVPLADKTVLKVTVLNLPDSRNFSEEDLEQLTNESAALAVLEEAMKYDQKNERLFAAMLDIVYQRRPLDMDGFLKVCNRAITESKLPEELKLSFCQRKLQFLEEFQDDVFIINAAYDELVSLTKALQEVRTRAMAKQQAEEGSAENIQPDIYPLHANPDLLNNPGAQLPSGGGSNGPPTHTPIPTFGRVAKGRPDLGMHSQAATADAFGNQMASTAYGRAVAYGQYTAGALDPMAVAQGEVSAGLPAPVPKNVPLMHPPMGDGSVIGTANAAWRKAAAAVGQSAILEQFSSTN